MTPVRGRIAVACLFAALAGCTGRAADLTTASQPSDSRVEPSSVRPRGRTQMWTENCIRCHNARLPGYYSDREWRLVMHHMRLRSSMTKQEYDAILSFLQSAN